MGRRETTDGEMDQTGNGQDLLVGLDVGYELEEKGPVYKVIRRIIHYQGDKPMCWMLSIVTTTLQLTDAEWRRFWDSQCLLFICGNILFIESRSKDAYRRNSFLSCARILIKGYFIENEKRSDDWFQSLLEENRTLSLDIPIARN